MKRFFSGILCLFFLGLLLSGDIECKKDRQSIQNEAGFITIEPILFYFHYGSYTHRLRLQSSEARIWYSFHAADQDGWKKPLFVFFNGGPGSSTHSGLLSMYTSRYTLDNQIDSGGGDFFIPNPFSWTQIGNLLYIDARQTGFSYNLMNQVRDFGARFREFNAQNFNPFFDGADFIRVILRFLAVHPQLQRNPVIIVGESYGGARSINMLHILLNYTDYGDGSEMYQDKALVDEIQAHFNAVFAQYQNKVVPPEVISQQFGHQILIQPAISTGYQAQFTDELLLQPGGLIDQYELETGVAYDPNVHNDPLSFISDVAGRDIYIHSKRRGWLDGFFMNAARLLRYTNNLILMTGMNVTTINELYASARSTAYRVFDPEYDLSLLPFNPAPRIQSHFLEFARQETQDIKAEPGDLALVFGILQPWDRYFLDLNYHAYWAFHVFNVAKVRGYEVDFYMARFGRMFLKNVAHVNTFITRAPLDLVIYPDAIPPSLAMEEDILESVQYVKQPLNGEERPGYIILEYRSSAFPDIPNIGTKIIRFPLYSVSCHAVSLTQPEELITDVSIWLKENGIDVDQENRGVK